MAKGRVIAGDYEGYDVITYDDKCCFMRRLHRIDVDKSVVTKFDVVDNIKKGFLKKDKHLISIEFYNGKRSLIEVEDKEYKCVLRALY